MVDLNGLFYLGDISYKSFSLLIIYTFGISIYGVFVWTYYRSLAKRDIFSLNLEKYKFEKWKRTFSFASYVLEYIILFPIYVFLWFGVLSLFMLFLAKNQTIDSILLISMGLVASVRITSYYHEDLSKDIAKMLPLALLAVFLVEPNFFSIGLVKERLIQLPTFLLTIKHYIVFTILLEFVLRMLKGIAFLVFGPPKKESEEEVKEIVKKVIQTEAAKKK